MRNVKKMSRYAENWTKKPNGRGLAGARAVCYTEGEQKYSEER